MQMTFHDRAPLEKVRRLADGRITAVAKFARSGCYEYAGHEMGRPELAKVTVYRPESEVFDEAAMASFAHKSITVGHPVGGVTVDNWKQVAAGWTEGKVARDGEYVEIPMMLADASAVKAYDSGVNQLSAGYTSELTWGDGVAPDGTKYQATMSRIRADHIAIVAQGRAGPLARIGDSAMTNDAETLIAADVARQRMVHDQKFAFLGDRAPTFDDGKARLIAAGRLDHGMAAVRDAAREFAATDPGVEAARSGMIADLHGAGRTTADSNADMRDVARAASYS